jgi:hypothetical protein
MTGAVASGAVPAVGGGGPTAFTALIDSYTPIVNYYMEGVAADDIADDAGNIDLSHSVSAANDEQSSGWTGAGNGFYFDGGSYGSSYSSVDSLDALTTGSIILCIDIDSIGSTQCVWSHVKNYDTSDYIAISITSSGEVEIDITDASYQQNIYRTTTASLSASTNYSIVITQNGSGWQVYVNGVSQTVSTITEAGASSMFFDDVAGADTDFMGVRGGYGFADYFTGYIYHLAVVTDALDGTDATDVYNAHSTGSS